MTLTAAGAATAGRAVGATAGAATAGAATAGAATAGAGFRRKTRVERCATGGDCYVVHALGRDFRVSAEMAAIFLRQVERVLASAAPALVILRHAHGVELLLVTDDTSFSIRPSTPADELPAPPAYPRMRG